MATKKTAVSEEATRASKTSQAAKKAPARAKKQAAAPGKAAAPKAVRAKKPASAPKVVRAKNSVSIGTTDVSPASIANALGPEERRQLIAEAAYLRAESRGFTAGSEAEDWLLAEQEIDRRLRAG